MSRHLCTAWVRLGSGACVPYHTPSSMGTTETNPQAYSLCRKPPRHIVRSPLLLRKALRGSWDVFRFPVCATSRRHHTQLNKNSNHSTGTLHSRLGNRACCIAERLSVLDMALLAASLKQSGRAASEQTAQGNAFNAF